MSRTADAPPTHADFIGVTGLAFVILILTIIHHAYGAVVFDTPWRLDILYLALPMIVIIAAARALAAHRSPALRKAAIGLGALVIAVGPIALIGLYEGGYNHVVKNGVHVLAGAAETMRLFPPPLHELPSDVLFEVTGMAQFPASVAAAASLLRLVRGLLRG